MASRFGFRSRGNAALASLPGCRGPGCSRGFGWCRRSVVGSGDLGLVFPVTPRWSRALDEWVSGKASPATLARLRGVSPAGAGSAAVPKWLTTIEQLVDAGHPFDDRRIIIFYSRFPQPL